MRMVALTTFKIGGSKDIVSAGQEFDASTDNARHYERHGMAIPWTPPASAKARPAAVAHPEPSAPNPAAAAGPFASAGGETGAEAAPSSSPAGRAPRTRSSSTPKGGRRSSASTKAGA